MKIVTLNGFEPDWIWLRDVFVENTDLTWSPNQTPLGQRVPKWMPRPAMIARLLAAWKAAGELGSSKDLLVTHGGLSTMYGAIAAKLRRGGARHLSYLNFTDLPTGARRLAMTIGLRNVDRFVVFSTMERMLYARHFGLPVERFEMVHWGVHRPSFNDADPALETGEYICALGSQARDYALLCDAMRQVPQCRLVIVATPDSMLGTHLPPNVSVHQNISLTQAMNILGNSRFMVVPLRAGDVPCGHVTLVSAMHLGKAVICTDSSGVRDYVRPGVTGHLVEPGNVNDMARTIGELNGNPAEIERLGAAGSEFATTYCSESSIVRHFRGYLNSLGVYPRAASDLTTHQNL